MVYTTIDTITLFSVFCHSYIIQEDLGITFNQALELYKLSYQVHDDDTKDEQLAGFGELIQDLIRVLDINEAIQDLIEVLDKE